MLTWTFLGVGSAFAKQSDQSNVLVEAWSKAPENQSHPDDTLLIDFGNTGPRAWWRLKSKPGFHYLDYAGENNYSAIRKLFITHTHADHVGGLEEFAQVLAYRQPHSSQHPQLFGTPELLARLWNQCLSGGLDVLHGRVAALADYFEIVHVTPDAIRPAFSMLDRYNFHVVPTDHVRVIGGDYWPSYGLVVCHAHNGERVVYSGDTRFLPETLEFSTNAKLIFHEVELDGLADSVHTPLETLRELPEQVKKKIVLYHLSDRCYGSGFEFVQKEFAGFATPHVRYVAFGD